MSGGFVPGLKGRWSGVSGGFVPGMKGRWSGVSGGIVPGMKRVAVTLTAVTSTAVRY
ncbi:hypothetical protein Alo02nite_27620 [Actinoplanes lobatus]|uniref:Uncharacterized protein n=1 Tax=Actinoplanes lobatus TaxID=113568 RepID=A0ABQ4AFT5_9ACTN|nr:hypothetical protein Alo02nite_27620 [Actinoplanes lobatus]